MGLPLPRWAKRKLVQHAADPLVVTPRPTDFGELGQPTAGDLYSLFSVKVPDPEHVELLCMVSHEVGSSVKAIREAVWRRDLRIEPVFGRRCLKCGVTTDETAQECPSCHAEAGYLAGPDEAHRQVLERWRLNASETGEKLEDLGRRMEDDANKHDNLFSVFRFAYALTPTGEIGEATLQEVRRGDPRYFRVVKDERGRIGGKLFVCLWCRSTEPKYRAQPERAPCTACGRTTYDAWYVEVQSSNSSEVIAYFLSSEVVNRSPHYGGSSPLMRIWDKAISIVWMDKYVVFSFDPRRDKRMDKVLAIIGGQPEAVEKWAREDAARRKKNPYALATLHLPIVGTGAEARPDLKVVDLGDEQLKGQHPELRKEYAYDIWRELGVMPAQQGDLSQAGGLNNEGLQLRVGAQRVEGNQRHHRAWLDRLQQALGVTDFRYCFEESLEEQEQLDADLEMKYLDVADKAAGLGLEVRWQDGKPLISNGVVKKPEPQPFGMGGFGPQPTDEERGPKQVREAPDVEQAGRMPRSDAGVPSDVDALFKGPSGSVAAADAVYGPPFAGLSIEVSEAIKAEVIEALRDPRGWNVTGVMQRIQPLLEGAGLEPEAAKLRAESIARMETGSIVSEWKLRLMRAEQGEVGAVKKYRVVGADDHRTTKLSRWIRAEVGQGRPLEEVLAVMDRGIALAKGGAFTEHGQLAGVPGEAVKLPGNFRRRGFVCHFGERDNVVEAT